MLPCKALQMKLKVYFDFFLYEQSRQFLLSVSCVNNESVGKLKPGQISNGEIIMFADQKKYETFWASLKHVKTHVQASEWLRWEAGNISPSFPLQRVHSKVYII